MTKNELAVGLVLALALSGISNLANADGSVKSQADHEVFNLKYGNASATLMPQPVMLANTTTADYQDLKASGALHDGGYLLVWETTTINPSEGARFYFQRFDFAGQKVGRETRLPLTFQDSSIAVLTSGDIIVAYRGRRDAQGNIINFPYGETGVFIQRFDAGGTQVLPETAVASTLGSSVSYENVSTLPLADGKFVVHWRSVSQTAGIIRKTFSAQSFDHNSQRAGSPVVLSADNFPAQRAIDYSIQAVPDGGFMLYKSMIDLSNISGCFGAMSEPIITSAFYYDENLVPKQILAPTHCAILLPLLRDRYMFFGANSAGPYSQLIDSNGSMVGPQKPIAARTPFRSPALTIFTGRTLLVDGSYLLIWFIGGNEFKGQRYTSKGDPTGEVISNISVQPRDILPLTGGDVILAWSGFNESNTTLLDVYTQRLSNPDETKNLHKYRELKFCLEDAKGMKGHAQITHMVECFAHLNER